MRSVLRASVAGDMPGYSISTYDRILIRFRTNCFYERCEGTPTVLGCCSTLSGGSKPPCNWKTAPLNPERRGRRKGQSFHPCWPIFSSITRSIVGMTKHYPDVPFERFADDALCHCVSEEQA